jgi:hypothetical protein
VPSCLAVMTFVTFFEVGLGPVPWLIVAEMFDAKHVATAMSISCIVNWTCNFVVGVTFPSLQQELGAWCFVPFMVILAFTFVYVLAELPETHGKSVEEVQKMARSVQEGVQRRLQISRADDAGAGADVMGDEATIGLLQMLTK